MKKYFKFLAALLPAMLIAISIFMFSPLFSLQTAHATVTCDNGLVSSNGLCLPQASTTAYGGGSINGLILTIINLMLSVAAVISILFIVWGGFQYITSAGNSEKAENGQKTVTNAMIGLAIVIMAFVIVGVINTTVSSCLASGGIIGCF